MATATDTMPAAWLAFIEENRTHYPTVALAADEAWGRGFDVEDVQGVQRRIRGGLSGGVSLVLVDGDRLTATAFY